MDKIETLRKLIGEDAIDFFKANEEDYNNQLETFINMNRGKYICGLDLANGKDITVYGKDCMI